MKKSVMAVLIFCAASLTASARGIDGKWISEMQVGDADGKTYTHTSAFTLKNDGGLLTGTVVQTSAAPCSNMNRSSMTSLCRLTGTMKNAI